MSLALEGNALMKNKSCSALQCTVSCFLGPVASGAGSPMCVACAPVLCPGLFIQSGHLQRLSLPIVGSVWSQLGRAHFNDMCWSVCEMRPVEAATSGTDVLQNTQVRRQGRLALVFTVPGLKQV